MQLNSVSRQAVFVEVLFGDTLLSTGSGFIVLFGGHRYFLTNRHVVTGRHQDTDKPISSHGGIPDRLRLTFSHRFDMSMSANQVVELFDRDRPLWIEHPTLGPAADFVALRCEGMLTRAKAFSLVEPDEANNPYVGPTTRVSVVGYPFGIRNGGYLPIWATGFVASEVSVDHEGMPVFLVDARTRQGQSGAPVVFYKGPGDSLYTANGGMAIGGGEVIKLLGIYSGRVNTESDLGRVWKVRAIAELLAHAASSYRTIPVDAEFSQRTFASMLPGATPPTPPAP